MIAITYTVIGFGWLAAVTCILRKHDWKKSDKFCLARDLVAATFTSITLVLVINLSFTIITNLSTIESQNSELQRKLLVSEATIGELKLNITNLTNDNSRLIDDRDRTKSVNSTLHQKIAKLKATNTTIVDELISLREKNELQHPMLAKQPIQKHFGVDHAIQINHLEFTFTTNSTDTITCRVDRDTGNGLSCR